MNVRWARIPILRVMSRRKHLGVRRVASNSGICRSPHEPFGDRKTTLWNIRRLKGWTATFPRQLACVTFHSVKRKFASYHILSMRSWKYTNHHGFLFIIYAPEQRGLKVSRRLMGSSLASLMQGSKCQLVVAEQMCTCNGKIGSRIRLLSLKFVLVTS